MGSRTGSQTTELQPCDGQGTVAKPTDDRQVTATTNQTVSDLKPGWAAVILGADNTDTTTTATLTTTQTVDVNMNDTTTSTLTMFGSYNIVLYTDILYSSYAALDRTRLCFRDQSPRGDRAGSQRRTAAACP